MATFVSKRRELRIIVKPADRTFDEARRPVILRGERVEFHEFRFKTENPELVTWLMQHPLYGKEYICAENDPVPQKPAGPEMITGSKTTLSGQQIIRPDESTYVSEAAAMESPITKDEIEVMIDQKFDTLLERMMGIMQSQAALKEEAKAPKRTFTCPIPGCGMVFKSGIEVGKHKREAHGTPVT